MLLLRVPIVQQMQMKPFSQVSEGAIRLHPWVDVRRSKKGDVQIYDDIQSRLFFIALSGQEIDTGAI
jgi:hypothetical protein